MKPSRFLEVASGPRFELASCSPSRKRNLLAPRENYDRASHLQHPLGPKAEKCGANTSGLSGCRKQNVRILEDAQVALDGLSNSSDDGRSLGLAHDPFDVLRFTLLSCGILGQQQIANLRKYARQYFLVQVSLERAVSEVKESTLSYSGNMSHCVEDNHQIELFMQDNGFDTDGRRVQLAAVAAEYVRQHPELLTACYAAENSVSVSRSARPSGNAERRLHAFTRRPIRIHDQPRCEGASGIWPSNEYSVRHSCKTKCLHRCDCCRFQILQAA